MDDYSELVELPTRHDTVEIEDRPREEMEFAAEQILEMAADEDKEWSSNIMGKIQRIILIAKDIGNPITAVYSLEVED